MYGRVERLWACPLWSQRTAAGTVASVAAEMQPRRAQTPEKSLVLAPTSLKAMRIMLEKLWARRLNPLGSPLHAEGEGGRTLGWILFPTSHTECNVIVEMFTLPTLSK
jgi:hypothetical protein